MTVAMESEVRVERPDRRRRRPSSGDSSGSTPPKPIFEKLPLEFTFSSSIGTHSDLGMDNDDDIPTRGRGRSVVIDAISSPNPPRSRSPPSSGDEEPTDDVEPRRRARSVIDSSSGSPSVNMASNAGGVSGADPAATAVPGEDDGTEMSSTSIVAKAANLTKLYLAGGAPVRLDFPPPMEGTQTHVVTSPKGVLCEKTMEVLSEGLHHLDKVRKAENGELVDTGPTEEEKEEEELANEEARRLREEKKLQEDELREVSNS